MAAALASDRIGERLSRVRQAAGLSVRALAARAGVRNTTVGYIEQGHHQPAVALVERLALALGVRPAWLAFGDGREPAGLPPSHPPPGEPMSSDPILDLFDGIRQHQTKGERALHKPLLLLLALGRLQGGAQRLTPFDELEAPLRDLMGRFGTTPPRPEYPFWHLRQDGLWELVGDDAVKSASASPGAAQLRAARVCGGFSAPIHRALVADPALRQRVVIHLLDKHFPAAQHDPLRGAVGL